MGWWVRGEGLEAALVGERPEQKSHEMLGWLLGLFPLTQALFAVSLSQAEQAVKSHFLQGNPSVALSIPCAVGSRSQVRATQRFHNETALPFTCMCELKTPSPSNLASDVSRIQDVPGIEACLLCAYAHFYNDPSFYSLSPGGSRTS